LLNGPIKIQFFPFPKAKLNNAIMTLNFKGNNAQITAKEFDFDLGWSFIFSDKIDIKSINGKFVTFQFFGKEGKSQKFVIDSFSGSVRSSCCDIDIPSFNIQTGKDNIQGDLNIQLLTNIPVVKGKVRATQLALPLYSSQDTAREKALSAQQFPLGWMSEIEGQVDLHVDKLLLNDKSIKNVDVNFNLKNKTLTIIPKTKMAGGQVDGRLIIKQQENSMINLEVALNVVNSDANFFLKKFSNNSFDFKKIIIEEGLLDYSYVGTSNGKNIGDLMSNISGNTNIKLKNAKITFLKNTLTGELNLSSVNKIKTIQGKLFSQKFEMPSQQDNWNFEWLKNVQGQIDLDINDLFMEKVRASKAKISLKMNNNLLTILPVATIAHGKFSGKFSIQPRDNSNYIKIGFSINDARASDFLKLFAPNAGLTNGNIQVNFDGSGHGVNLQSVMATLFGRTLIYIQELSIDEKRIDSRYVDLFSALWKVFTPTQSGTLLRCAVLRFDIQNGQATANQSIGMETDDLSILGGGNIDLASKEINFTFDMQPRSHFNIELGSFNNIVYLKGTLDQPQVSASMQGVVKEGGSVALGIVTGGMSLLVEKLVKMTTQNKSVCQQVLSGGS
jgi:hypothetical protein